MTKQDHELEDRAQLGEAEARDQRQLILVIEDDEALRELLKIALDHHGYSVITAATEPEAESAIQQWGDAGLDLVISDINLTPGHLDQEGYALYQRWSRKYPTLIYMLMSADPTNRRLPAIQNGSVHFVEKPFRIGPLIDDIRGCLDPSQSGDAAKFSPQVATSVELALAGFYTVSS